MLAFSGLRFHWDVCIILIIVLHEIGNHFNLGKASGQSDSWSIEEHVNYNTTKGIDLSSFDCTVRVQCQSNNCCSSKRCEIAALNICKIMNFDADPCSNFYNFTCGSFEEDSSAENILETNMKSEFHTLRDLLSEPISLKEEFKTTNEMKSFYATCMNVGIKSSKETNFESTKQLISNLGGWHVTRGENETGFTFSWESYITKWMENGIYPDDIFTFNTVRRYRSNDDVTHIDMKFPTLSLPLKILVHGEEHHTVQAYFNFMRDVTNQLYPNEDETIHDQPLKDILDFEISLARFIEETKLSNENDHQDRDSSEIHDMKTLFGNGIPWDKILSSICMKNSLCNNTKMEHFKNSAMPKVHTFITEAMDRSEVVGNYVVWKAIAKVGAFTNPTIYAFLYKHFRNEGIGIFMNGQFDENCLHSVDIWACNCIDVTKKTYSTALNYLYQKKIFKSHQSRSLEKMANGIKNYFSEKIDHFVDGIGNKQHLRSLMNRTKFCMNFHPSISSLSAVKAYYRDDPVKNLQINITSFLEWYSKMNAYNIKNRNANVCRSNVSDADLQCKLLVNMDRNTDLIPTEVMVKEETIFISPRYIQTTEFHPDLPHFVNYGRIGFYIARLLASFIFHADGEHVHLQNLTHVKVMMKNDACVKQEIATLASQMDEENICESFMNTMATPHTILDSIAWTAVYNTYREMVPDDNFMPGYEHYRSRSLLWIAFGTWMCDRKNTDLSRVRVLMAARKQEHFASDFQCQFKKPLNPDYRCANVWTLLTNKTA